MYSKLSAAIKVNNDVTECFDCNIETRQGCLSSPMLFSLFINDLIELIKIECSQGIYVNNSIEDIFALLFADDIANVSDTVVGLQKQLNVIEKFCNCTGMNLNLEKTKIIVFRNGGILKKYEHFYFKGYEVEVVNYQKNLGTYFSNRLSWTKTLQIKAAQARKASLSIYKYQYEFGYLTQLVPLKILMR